MSLYKGSCHCGQIQFEVDCDISKVMECNCSICNKKGAIYAPARKNHLKIVQGEEELILYQFGTKTAKHYFCKHCGIHPFVKPRLAPERWTVNIRCLEGVNVQNVQPEIFDGENWEEAAQAFQNRK